MSDAKALKAKLQIIKELAPEKSVQQLADVMIEMLGSVEKNQLGFRSGEK